MTQAVRLIGHPPDLPPKVQQFANKLLADIVRDMPREGRDIMLTSDLRSADQTTQVLDHCTFFFDGTVERGWRIHEDKVFHMATFTPKQKGKKQ